MVGGGGGGPANNFGNIQDHPFFLSGCHERS